MLEEIPDNPLKDASWGNASEEPLPAADRAPGVGGCLSEPDAQRAETAAAENSHPREREGAWMTRDQYRYGVWIFLWD